LFFLAEFIEIVFISAVVATIFFGGYQVPFLDQDGFLIGGWYAQITPEATSRPVAGSAGPRHRGLQLRFGKSRAPVLVPAMIRWTSAVPRDQLMNSRLEAACRCRSPTSW
jgi:NADH:ubiquinone oxidoreductase subunit H